MNDQPSNTASISPVEQLGNVYETLADDVLAGHIETDQPTNQRASQIARAAIEKALGSSRTSPRREAGWFARSFGLHPVIALVLTIVAVVVNVFAWGTFGLGEIIALPAAPFVAILTWKMQKRYYGDDNLTAFLKGLAAMVLTILPIFLAPFVFIPAGIVGWVWGKRRVTTPK